MPHLKSNGINLYYEEHGSGEPLILIMGFTVSSIGWHWNVPSFAQDFRTIVFDNRGVGQSDKPDIPYSMPMFADDTAGLLDGLGIDQAHVFGISMGGMIAQEFALRHPQRVKTLILGCTNCGGPHTLPSKDPEVLNMLGNIETFDVQQAALAMTKVAVTPWFMQKHMDMLLQMNQMSMQHPTPQYGMVRQMQAIQGTTPTNACPDSHSDTGSHRQGRWPCACREFGDSRPTYSQRGLGPAVQRQSHVPHGIARCDC